MKTNKYILVIALAFFCTVGNLFAVDKSYYNSLDGKSGTALREAMTTLLYNKHTTGLGYNWVFDGIDWDSDGNVYDIYSDCGHTKNDETSSYKCCCDAINREHVVPQSTFNSQYPQYADRHHLFVVDGKVNGYRSDYAFGECSGGAKGSCSNASTVKPSEGNATCSNHEFGKLGTSTFTEVSISEKVYEPSDDYKGDIARAIMYMVIRYATASDCKVKSGSGTGGNSYPVTAWSSSTHCGIMFSSSLSTNYGLSAYGKALLMKWHRNDPVSAKEIARNNGVEAKQGNRNPFVDLPDLAEYLWGTHAGDAVALSSLDIATGSGGGSSTYQVILNRHGATQTITCTGTYTLPTSSTEVNACEGWPFAGWTTSSSVNTTTEPSFTTSVSTAATLYAVYSNTVSSAPRRKAAAATGTILWAEDFSGYSANNVPSGSTANSHTGTTVYGGGSVSYAVNNGGGTTKIYNENNAGGTSPELLIAKSNGSFSVSGIPTGDATAMTLTFKMNKTSGFTISSSTTGITVGSLSYSSGTATCEITNTGVSSFNLTITYTPNNNSRVDNFNLTVKTAGSSGGGGGTTTTTTYKTSPECGTAHTITLSNNGSIAGGGFEANVTSAYAGATITLTAYPNDGYSFSSWTVTKAGGETVSVASNQFTMPDADVTISATFTENPKYTIRFYNNGSVISTQSVYENSEPDVPSDPEACEGYEFVGWYTSLLAANNTTEEDWITDFTVTGAQDYYAVYSHIETSGEGGSSTIDDVLTRETTGVSNGSTSYSTWSNKTGSSGAVYTGNSAGGNDAIQLRSNNSNSGIITTTSGGKATKVAVTWQSGTASGRTIYIYGKNTAYSAVSDLYGNNAGTQIGSIVCGTSTELTISSDYPYIGIRSSSGALYLTNVTITWSTSGGSSSTTYYTSSPDCNTPQDVTVTFNANGGTGTMANQTVSYNTATALTANTFTRTGYTFQGWATSADGAKAYDNQQSVTFTNDITLYAVWKANSHNVAFTPSPTGASVTINGASTSPQSADYNSTVTIAVTPATHYTICAITAGGASGNLTLSGTGNSRTFTMPDADVEVSVTMAEEAKYTVNWYVAGTPTAETNYAGEALTGVDASQTECNGKVFVGWTATADYSHDTDAPSDLFTDPTAQTMPSANTNYYAVFATAATSNDGGTATVVDKLTRETTGATSNTYIEWSDKTVNSSAVYAGNSAGDKSSIQLRSNNSNSGIITTASGGKAAKVTVEWQSDTSDDRVLNVYGKSTAYTAATDLYNSTNAGTLIGTIAKKTATELAISNDYEYIGIRSASGAIYLTSVSVTWTAVGGSSTTTYSGYTTSCAAPTLITITFHANGGIGTMANQTVPYNTATALTTNTFTRTGYTFRGWATSTEGEKVYNDGADVTLTENTTLYAVWTVNSYTITTNAGTGGTLSTSPSGSANFGTTVTITATPDETHTLGSITVKDAANNDVSVSGTGDERTFTMPASNVTVSATFTEKQQYTINFIVDGETISTQNLYDGATAQQPTDPEACEGYTFVGWWTAAIAEETTTSQTWVTDFTVSGAQDYYAVFSRTESSSGDTSSSNESVTFSDLYSTNTTLNQTTIAIGTHASVIFDKGSNSNAPQYYTTGSAIRIYGGGTCVVSTDAGNITAITLTFSSGEGTNNITANVGTYNAGSWSGEASSVTFSIEGSSGHRRIAGIAVTISGGSTSTTYYTSSPVCVVPCSITPTMSFTNTTVELTTDDASYTQAVTISNKGAGQTVTYSSSDETVATVNASSVVTLLGKIGSTTITASVAEDADYCEASASYTLTVTKAPCLLTGISLNTEDVSLIYTTGDVFSADELIVTADYSNCASSTVTPTSISSPDMSTAGTKTITVTYTENGITQTATFDIEVSDPVTYTVTWNVDGVESSVVYVEDDYLVLPSTPADCEGANGKKFVGWTASSSVDGSAPADLFTTASGIVTADKTYYAVFATATTTGGGSSSNDFELYSGMLTEGDYLIVYDGGAMNTTVSSNRLGYESVTSNNDVITTTNTSIIWHIAASGDYWTIYNTSANAYAAATGTKNQAQMLASGSDDKLLWSCSSSASSVTYDFVNKKNTSSSVNAILRKNDSYGFACYASATGGALSLYKKASSGATIYSNYSLVCDEPCALTSITLNTSGVTTSFTMGDTFTSEGLVVTANYSNCASATVTPASISSPDMTSVGTKTITVSYTENGTTKTATYSITVNAPVSYTITLDNNGSVTGGTFTASPASATAGTTVTLSATPATGYRFVSWSVIQGSTPLAVSDNQFAMPAGDVTVSATFEAIPQYTIRFFDNGSRIGSDQSVYEGSLPIVPDKPTPCEGYTFAGWWTAAIAEETTTAQTWVTDFTVSGAQDYYAVYSYSETGNGGGSTDDVLNRATTGITGNDYSSWSNKTGTSGAVYAGNSAGGNSSIQLRSNYSTSGIITTTSGGKATKVAVTWNSNTANDRKIDVYGKNSAYSAASDLYSTDTQGTKIGSILYGTSTELTITSDYEYIGIRSNSGALYLDNVTITWSSASGSTTYYTSSPICVTPCTKLETPAVAAVAGNEQITLTWADVEGADHYTVTIGTGVGFTTECGNEASVGNIAHSGTTNTCIITGLTNGLTYTTSVVANAASETCDSDADEDTTTPVDALPTEVTVTFDANGGTGTMDAQVFPYDEEAALHANTFTRTGYTFTGWNTQASGSGSSYSDQAALTLTQNIILYAQWSKNSYTVTFTPIIAGQATVTVNGNSNGSLTAEYESTVSVAVAPETEYKVNTVSVSGGLIVTNEGNNTFTFTMPANDVTVTVTMVAKPTYTVRFFDNGDKVSELTVMEGEVVTPPAEPNGCTGYPFVGWWTAEMAADNTESHTWINDFTARKDQDYYAVYSHTETSGGVATTSNESVTFSDLYSTNTTLNQTTIAIGTHASVIFDKGSNSNAPQYYTTGSAIRIYGGGTCVVSTDAGNITAITLTFSSGEGTNNITANVGTYNAGSWSGEASSVTFSIEGSSGHRRIAGIAVTISNGGSITYYTTAPSCPTIDMVMLTDFSGAYLAVMPTLVNNGAEAAPMIKKDETYYHTSAISTVDDITWQLVERTTGCYIRDAAGNYLTVDGTSVLLGIEPYLWHANDDGRFVTADNTGLCYSATEKAFVISSDDAYASDETISGCVTKATDVILDIALAETRNDSKVKNGYYATLCLPFDVPTPMLTGARAFNVVGKQVNDEGLIAGIVMEEEIGILTAGKPYVIQYTDVRMDAWYAPGEEMVDKTQSAVGLVGNLAVTPMSVPAGCYGLSNNLLRKVAEGANATVGQYKAYFNLSEVPEMSEPSEMSAYRVMYTTDMATDMEQTSGNTGINWNEPVYNILGIRVDRDATGVLIQNGMKFIIRF